MQVSHGSDVDSDSSRGSIRKKAVKHRKKKSYTI